MNKSTALIMGLQCIIMSEILDMGKKQEWRSWFYWIIGMGLFVYSMWATN